jgi:phosphate/sulfate permease
VIGASLAAGVGLGLLTYQALRDLTGSLIFAPIGGVCFFALVAGMKVSRDRSTSTERTATERWLDGKWEIAASIALVILVVVVTVMAIAVRQPGVALVDVVLAIPLLVVLSRARRRV